MTITNTWQALGSWSIKLKAGTPLDVLGRLAYLGHIAISIGRPDVRVSGDSLLSSARYVGPLRKVTFADDGFSLSGAGMSLWLGDENKKGPVITQVLAFTGTDFATVVTQLLAQTPSVKAGNIHNVGTGYTGYHQFTTVREALDFVCSTMTQLSDDPVTYRVNGDGSVDAGASSQLFQHDPVAVIARRGGGADMALRALPGAASVDEDVEDYATEVILLGQGEGLGIASAQSKLDPAQIPYKDLFGNVVRIARTVSQSSTAAANSLVQAQIALNQYAAPRDAVTLSSSEFDIEGTVKVGDSVWVYDASAGLVDESPTATQVQFRGERINPVKLRVSELSWPVEAGMSVAFRTPDGQWVDLTDYVEFETGDTQVTVGGYDRSLTNPTGRQEALGSRAAPNTSVPATPVFLVNKFVQAVYQSAQFGITKAQIQLRWQTPLNTDGTTVLDGDHYEIRYRTTDGPTYRVAANTGTVADIYPGSGLYPGSGTYPGDTTVGGSAAVIPPGSPATWAQCAGLTWAQMATWAQPIQYVAGPWLTAYQAWDQTSLLIQELTPGVPYQFEIRAVDNASVPNFSDWSNPVEVIMNGDTIPPPTPAPAEVASSLIAIEVTHRLGAASGGTFNLPADMHHFEVHGAYEPTFTCSPATLLGKIPANNGMIVSQTPVVATLQVQTTTNIWIKVVAVDEAGNRSTPSVAVQSSAQLIDDEHISNLSVSKVTAGEITSNWIQTAELSTAPAGGARAGLDALGLFAYNVNNVRVWEVKDANGDMVFYSPAGLPTMRCEAATGNIYLYQADGVTAAMKLTASSGLLDLVGKLTSGDGVGVGPTIVVDPGGTGTQSHSPDLRFYANSTSGYTRVVGFTATLPSGATGPATQIEVFSDGVQPDGGYQQWSSQGIWMGFAENGVLSTSAGFLQVLKGQARIGAGDNFSSASQITFGTDGTWRIDSEFNSRVVADNTGKISIVAPNNNFIEVSSTGISLVVNGTVFTPKTFVIDHPQDDPGDPQRWLVHACTESPTAGVEYTGEAVTVDGWADVTLPPYFEALCLPEGRTVQVTPIDELCLVAATPICGGRFGVRCSGPTGTRVHWLVKATRKDTGFDVEPRRADYIAYGDGPYRYLAPRVKGT